MPDSTYAMKFLTVSGPPFSVQFENDVAGSRWEFDVSWVIPWWERGGLLGSLQAAVGPTSMTIGGRDVLVEAAGGGLPFADLAHLPSMPRKSLLNTA